MPNPIGLSTTVFALTSLLLLSACGQVVANGPATRPVSDKIPHTTVQIEMVQVLGGMVTRKDKDGHEITYDLKPFLIQRTEARWNEWDVFYLGLDLPKDGIGDRDDRARKRRDAMLQPS